VGQACGACTLAKEAVVFETFLAQARSAGWLRPVFPAVLQFSMVFKLLASPALKNI
jgi:hypothetical protein